MALYQPPEGFQYDPNTGYYYKQVIAQNAAGKTMQVVTWFNADTGQYRQDTYPVNVQRQQAPVPASGRNGLVTGLIIGGAVLTQEYADRIGADAYSKDAMGSVRYVESLLAEAE